MIFPDLRVGWRLFIGKPLSSPLMLLSLSAGFCVCFSLLTFVWYSLQFDSDVPDHSRIFLVKNKYNIEPGPVWYDRTPFPVREAAEKSSLVEASVAVVSRPAEPFKVDQKILPVNLLIVQSSFMQVFGVSALQGDLADTLSHPDQIALTINAAIKLFGRPDVLGKSVEIYGQPYKVGAVLPDRVANTTVNYSALAGINSALLPDRMREIFFHYWDAFGGRVYLKLKPGVFPDTVKSVLQNAIDHAPFSIEIKPEIRQRLGNSKVMEIGLDRLSEVYLDDTILNSQDSGPHSSWQILLSIAIVAFLILLLVVTNYVNFATMQAINRHREIAIRKVLGVTAAKLAIQFWFESLAVTLLATFGGLVLTELMLPIFAALVNCQLEDVYNVQFLCLALLLGVIVGSLAGIYPAWVAMRIKPYASLAGRWGDAVGGIWLRRILSVIQFSAVITLSSTALVIAWQGEFASHASQGFNPANMLVVEFPGSRNVSMIDPDAYSLRDEISRIPGVLGVATSQAPLGRSNRSGHSEFIRPGGKSANITNRPVSPNFFDVLGVQPLAGRLLNAARDREVAQMPDAKSIVLNAAAARALGFLSPADAVDQLISVDLDEEGIQSVRIVGIVPDIRQQSLHESPLPSAYWPYLYTSTLTVKYTESDDRNLTELEERLLKLANLHYPNEIVNIQKAQNYFNENYETDVSLSKLLGLASIFSVIISAFGIYVLSTFSVQRLSKRIAISKLYGAAYRDIARLVGKEFFLLVLVGTVIGLPIAAIINFNYLSTFVERAPVGIWPLILPMMMVVAIAFFATSQQVLKSMKTNPARILL